MTIDGSDLSARFSATKRKAKRLIKPLEELLQIKWSDKDSLPRISKILARIPAGEPYGQAAEEVKRDLKTVVDEANRDRRERFGASEAQFFKGCEPAPREVANGWRVGPIEMELNKEKASARANYNRYPLSKWSPVSSVDDLRIVLAKSLDSLERSKLPVERLTRAMEDAYRFLRVEAKRTQIVSTDFVPVRDFYREVRVALARIDLLKKPGRKLTAVELPEWAFVYNLDLFIAAGAGTSAWRMNTQTGSQSEQERGIGMTINGLEQESDYRVVCYVQLKKR